MNVFHSPHRFHLISFTSKTHHMKSLLTVCPLWQVKEKKSKRCVLGRNFVYLCIRTPEQWLLRQTPLKRGICCCKKPLCVKLCCCSSFYLFLCCMSRFPKLLFLLCPFLQVQDPRFEWTRDKMLVLREVTHADQGLYAIKLASGFTYETVRLTVSGTVPYISEILFLFISL